MFVEDLPVYPERDHEDGSQPAVEPVESVEPVEPTLHSTHRLVSSPSLLVLHHKPIFYSIAQKLNLERHTAVPGVKMHTTTYCT